MSPPRICFSLLVPFCILAISVSLKTKTYRVPWKPKNIGCSTPGVQWKLRRAQQPKFSTTHRLKMATGKIRADSGFARPCPRPKSCARARARHPQRAATYARACYPRARLARRHARTPARSLHLGATGGRHCSCTLQYISNCHSICYSCGQI
jgi:hypothetical protein